MLTEVSEALPWLGLREGMCDERPVPLSPPLVPLPVLLPWQFSAFPPLPLVLSIAVLAMAPVRTGLPVGHVGQRIDERVDGGLHSGVEVEQHCRGLGLM